MGIPFGTGIQFLFDAQQRFVRSALPVYLQVRNFEDTGDYIEVGVPYAPTGAQAFYTGVTNILIQPPPGVQDVSLHNIGLLAGRLNFGSRIFEVSNTFVQNQQAKYRIADPYNVWRDRDGKYKVVGILYNSRMFSIESITHKEVAGKTINWHLIANALELQADNL